MGQSQSFDYMNIVPLGSIMETTELDLYDILRQIENLKGPIANDDASMYSGKDGQSTISGMDSDGKVIPIDPTFKDEFYQQDEESFIKILIEKETRESDLEFFKNLFRLIDSTGIGHCNIQHVLISFAPLLARSPEHCLEACFRIIDNPKKTRAMGKLELLNFFRILNNALYFYGDKYITQQQISDLVDSVYTSAGLIDGFIAYEPLINYIATHPIVEMLISPQYQGDIRQKLLNDEQIEEAVYFEKLT